jgi:hypothetical protein
MNLLNKISIVLMLMSGVFLSSWTYNFIKDEAISVNADVDSVPRRCRVIKRYRSKGEVYKIIVQLNNNPSWQNGSIEILFEPKEGQAKPTKEQIILKPIKSKGKNRKDIEFESAEFEFSGATANQTYVFTLVSNDNEGKPLDKFQYTVSFGEESKGVQEVDAKIMEK